MKFLSLMVAVAVVGTASLAEAGTHRHHSRHSDEPKTDKGAPQEPEPANDVECEGFDELALCPGGWPMVMADEAKHRVKCCGAAENGKCPECNRCKPGSFADSCCDCDDDELVDGFWKNMHEFHSGIHKDGSLIGERDLIDLIKKTKGEMDVNEELKIKDVYQQIMEHVVPDDAKTTSGLAQSGVVIKYLRENPEVVDHMIAENESPSEGEKQNALDHTKAVTPEWFGGMAGKFAGHLPPPIIRRTGNGLWEVLVPNFEHPENGYYPAVYRHSNAEAKSYVAEKLAESLEATAKKNQMTENIHNKAAENTDLLNEKTNGYKEGHSQTHQEKDANLGRNNNDLKSMIQEVMHTHGRK